MAVKRIVANLKTDDPSALAAFYHDLLGLETVMDHGWIATLTSGWEAPVQISFASQGGSGTEVPDISVEVEDVDATYARARGMNCDIPYPLTREPWGVKRFYVRDPAGHVLNILSHVP